MGVGQVLGPQSKEPLKPTPSGVAAGFVHCMLATLSIGRKKGVVQKGPVKAANPKP